MASTAVICNQKGDILIYRRFRDDISRNEIMNFCNKIVATKAAKETPIIQMAGVSFIHTTHNDITFFAATKGNINASLILHFLHGFIKVARSYFEGDLNESAVRQNFSLLYELLDEVMDYGYPQLLDANLLKEYIRTGKQKKQPTDLEKLKAITVQATGAISWRAEGIRYKRNEVFIDIIESINVLLSSRGTVLKSDVIGRVCVKASLSGMPECKFGVNDKLLMKGGAGGAATGPAAARKATDKGIQIDDIKFHQCVRLGRFDRDRSITFIPPDGIFDVMTYRISENINLPFKIVPVIQEYPDTNKIELSIRIKAIFEESNFGTNVVCKIPVPPNTAQVRIFSSGTGKAVYEPDN